ncbi:MAG: polysaccharide deacetylase family protein [Mariniphaga sp.]|nr:polysaccharide deacetylase family protein [Mariniphaga sp.]MDD4226700.1 polysaccharide deacetylase family protein [Mariniphaga sp.]MDD4425750.1 polysaccharide deacetylase family protein [Mariniphaga sp.]
MINRRNFIKSSALTVAGFYAGACVQKISTGKLFLLRYDTEWWGEQSEMEGFFEQVIKVHREDKIPASFFCTGLTINNRKEVFRDFYSEVKNDPLFDIQNHSYQHIGLCKKQGQGLSLEEISDDYQRAFELHQKVFGRFPDGISLCGTPGESYPYFDSSESTKREFHMLAGLGLKMVNTHLSGFDESSDFCTYERLGYPGIMGFPSAYSDTSWMQRREFGDPLVYIFREMDQRAGLNHHMPLMLHDWVSWQHAPDKELAFVRKIVEYARNKGYQLITHIDCYRNKAWWQG